MVNFEGSTAEQKFSQCSTSKQDLFEAAGYDRV